MEYLKRLCEDSTQPSPMELTETDEAAYNPGFHELIPPGISTEPNLKALDMPYPRSGHRLLADGRYAISVGGFNPALWNEHNTDDTYYPILKEIWLFNLITYRWTKVTTFGSMPKELASHAALLHDNYVLLYGGTGVPFGHSSSNRFHVLNMKTGTWRQLPTSAVDDSPASLPPEQYGHAFVRQDDKFYVIGGTSGFQYNMQVFQLSPIKQNNVDEKQPSSFQWRALLRGAEVSPRYRHEAFYFGGKLHVLGGGTASTVCELSTVSVFDVSVGLWLEIPVQHDPEHGYPAPRRCHGLVVQEEGQDRLSVYISGGYDGENAFDDVWQFKVWREGNAIEYAWRKFPHNLPKPLYFHGMAITTTGTLLTFGGVDDDTQERTASVYRCLLKPPSLLEQSLRKVYVLMGKPNEQKSLEMATRLKLPQTCVDWLISRW